MRRTVRIYIRIPAGIAYVELEVEFEFEHDFYALVEIAIEEVESEFECISYGYEIL